MLRSLRDIYRWELFQENVIETYLKEYLCVFDDVQISFWIDIISIKCMAGVQTWFFLLFIDFKVCEINRFECVVTVIKGALST